MILTSSGEEEGYMIRRRPKNPEHYEVFGHYRMHYGGPKGYSRRKIGLDGDLIYE